MDNLLKWSQLQTGAIKLFKEEIQLTQLINSVISLFDAASGQKNIRIITEIRENPIIFADMVSMSSILRNLISNAIKFSKIGEKIIIKVEEDDKSIRLCVSDYGVGIPREIINQLFTLERPSISGTLNEKGSGLGLILTKELTEKNDGTIEVESTINVGTTFILSFPKVIAK